jgi:hypothetical protein
MDRFNPRQDNKIQKIYEKIKKYPELDKIAKKIGKDVGNSINSEVKNVESEMPYKAQYVLEELIKILQKAV